jgi:hypothetical protein
MRLTFRTRNASTFIAPKTPATGGADDHAQFPMLARSEAFAEDLTHLTGAGSLSEPFAFSCQRNSPAVATPLSAKRRPLLNL